ncbi:hypothetical protein [Paramicrobacterium fandaimingii]|uniref:hypothetical protein n=1 Tax=Paramicrobacterium fandaimingii TaxID=2708079 RepID=UPI00141EEBA8|nr:hypothetical protein [Microbacterium fandaimingii]
MPYEETELEKLAFESTSTPHITETDVFLEYTDHVGDIWRTYYSGRSERSAREADRYPLP